VDFRQLRLLLAVATLGAVGSTAPLRPPSAWTQFRLLNSGNAVVPGSLSVAWRASTRATYSSSPTVGGSVLFIGDNAGVLHALDIATGKSIWIAKVSKPIMSSPILYNGLVIVGEGDEASPAAATPSHPIHVGAGESALLAYNAQTGALQWRVPLPGSGMPTPAIVDGILVHHNGAGSVYGIDPQTGRVLYARDLHSIASMSAALPVGKTKFATLGVDTNAAWLLDARTGAPLARTLFAPNASGFGDCPPVFDGKALYCNYGLPPYGPVPMQSDRFAVERAFAVDLAAGKRLWDVYLEFGSLPRRNEAAIPLLAYNRLYMGSSVAPYMHALDRKTGKILWRKQVAGNVLGGIVATGGAIYFGDLSGYLWALNAKTGAVIGRFNAHLSFNVGSPIIAGQTLIIGSRGGTVLAVPLARVRASHDR
jgi:outer membrane protein assembly factor BamB